MTNFCFTVDLELGVGTEHSIKAKNVNSLLGRKAVSRIVELSRKYGIPTTFAIVGHLFLDSCNGHDNLIKPKISYYSKEWLSADPKTNLKENNAWYASDLVDLIKEHGLEIASHSFSHPPFNECSKEIAEQEITESIKVAKKAGVKLKSFVFPRNIVCYLDLLEKHGFTHFASDPFPKGFLIDYNPKQFSFNKPKKLLDFNLIVVPRTQHLYREKWTDNLKTNFVLRMVKLNNGFYHLWSHEYNLSSEKELGFLERIFKQVNS
ncbi:MAG: polysaccharide deacetylase family protein, partial [archaeon]